MCHVGRGGLGRGMFYGGEYEGRSDPSKKRGKKLIQVAKAPSRVE